MVTYIYGLMHESYIPSSESVPTSVVEMTVKTSAALMIGGSVEVAVLTMETLYRVWSL